jgi:hypothetical protein
MVKVMPTSDNIRKLVRHPSAGPFRETGPANWPEDAFTFRRLRDGDVVKVEDEPEVNPEDQGGSGGA